MQPLFVQSFGHMSRVLAYARISTMEQTTENQLREIHAAGLSIEPRRTVTGNLSGSVAAKPASGVLEVARPHGER